MRVCSFYSLAHNNVFGKLSIVGEITGWCMTNGNKSKSGTKMLGMLTHHRCYQLLTISRTLRMLMQLHRSGFAGKKRAWHWYGIRSMGYIGEKRRQISGMTQWRDNNDFSWLKPPGSAEGRTRLLDYTRSPLTCSIFCIEMLGS